MIGTIRRPSFINFEVLKEPWNEFKLRDGSTLRVKVVIKTILKEDDESFTFGSQHVVAVLPNPKHIGLRTSPPKPGEDLTSYIDEEDIAITSHTERWNVYRLPSEKITLSIKGVLVSASRTTRHDDKGMPIYVVNVQLLIKPKMKK